ncbi:aminoacyl-tRNA hydrolase [Oricola cellulosilytica]|uniref:Peptidyl-tRNA hydrolase n=1 Tax=Oricola cellulosilytica TaxID=1429082 RepID=A0A4R0PEX5_9HYPH|nr:aminoacyl-tRNA hydrolase [Oricola cellulosilytica]TCD15333.1 aminoacyl-tRNA hydrolase [Oricola cellulosilytica]
MLVIAGLGNPGAQYANHRHNIGFMAADAIVRRHSSFGPWHKKFSAEVSEGRLEGEKVLVIKPQTFMNRSGQAIGEALRFYKLETDALVVMYDELDLAPGKVRIKTGGGTGGHNGIRSIDAHCGRDYKRVRLGIGHPGSKERVTGHVLGDFAKADHEWLGPLLDAIGHNAEMIVKGDDSGFMNKLALAVGDKTTAKSGKKQPAETAPAKQQSHIRQARSGPQQPAPSGPMADLLKKLLGKGD